MKNYIATATFKICDRGRPIHTPSMSYELYEEDISTDIEIDVLAALNEDGRTHYPAFHEAGEPCTLQRPVGDLLYIWHAEKIEGAVFCLHLHDRTSRSSAGEGVTGNARALDDVSESASQLFITGRTPSPLSEHHGAARFNLVFDIKDGAPMDRSLWQSQEMLVELTELPESLSVMVKDLAEEITAKDHSLTVTLVNYSHQLFVRPILQFGDNRDVYTDFTRRVRIETVSDLFPSASAALSGITILVKMKLRAVDTAPSNIREAIVADTEIGYDFHRIGSLGQTSQQQSDNSRIPVRHALVAWLEDDDKTLRLNKVDTWLVNGLCIGEPYTMNEAVGERSFVLLRRYRNARSMEDLTAAVAAYRDSGDADDTATDPDASMPIAPVYSWKPLNAVEPSLGLNTWPRSGIIIAVKCMNMLRKHSGGSNIIFPSPKNMQLQVEINHTLESVRTLIEGELQQKSHRDGRTSSCLFKPVLRGKWKMLLWVMPQLHGQVRMYRYEGGGLTQYLDPVKGKRDGTLYMEAHIVPQYRS